jgi:transmembrane sensor
MIRSRFEILQREALDRLTHATSGHATVGDLRELEAWRMRSAAHAEAYRNAIEAWERLGAAAKESATAADRALIAGRITRAGTHILGRRAFFAGGAAAAAAATGFIVVRPPLGLWPSLADLRADYRTGTGENRSLSLAQGISLEMNTRTSIARGPTDSDATSIELIAGEVEISAKTEASAPLTVIAADGHVTAADAKFNLRRDPGAVQVTCVSGVVQVECAGRATTLLATQQLAYSQDGIGPIITADPAVVTAWRQGLLIFRNEPLAAVVDEVNRYWRGRIILLNADLGRRRVSARVELARLDEVISYVQSVMGVEVRMLPGGVVLLT